MHEIHTKQRPSTVYGYTHKHIQLQWNERYAIATLVSHIIAYTADVHLRIYQFNSIAAVYNSFVLLGFTQRFVYLTFSFQCFLRQPSWNSQFTYLLFNTKFDGIIIFSHFICKLQIPNWQIYQHIQQKLVFFFVKKKFNHIGFSKP